jgi:DNA-binding CsgD family transcriptional regulator
VKPLIGRAAELAVAVEVVTGDSSERCVLVEGPAGIGKTVFLDATLEAAAAAGIVILLSRPTEAGARMALLGLHDLLEPVAAETLPALPPAQRDALAVALGLGLGGGGEGEAVDESLLAMAVVGVLRRLAGARRTLVAIDDLQWLDPSSASVLEVALSRLHDDVRVVATRRDDEAGGRLPIERLYRDRLVHLRLGGLTLSALHRVLADRLTSPVARPMLIRIHRLSQGNPFHALELGRSLEEGSSGDHLTATLPTDLGVLLRRRIERLPAAVRDVVAVVALTPRPSTGTIGRALAAPPADVDVRSAVAVDAGLLVAGSPFLALAHPLVGSAVRVVVGPAGVRAHHRRLADVVDDPDEAAVHLSMAATGPDETVAGALEAAADRLLARGATVDAIDLLDRTIQLTPASRDVELVRRRLLLVRALVLAGDTRRAGAELDAEWVEAIPDPVGRSEAVLLLGIVQRYLGEHAAAIARHRDALSWVGDPATRARLHVRLAWLNERELKVALKDADRALELLDLAVAPHDYSFALLTSARIRLHIGRAADHEAIAKGAALQAIAGARDWNASTTPIDWAIWMEDWETALERLDAAERAAEEAGDETFLGALLRRRVEVETWSGRLADAAALVEQAIERAESTQQLPSIASSKARRALIRAHMGELDAAARDVAEATALADTFGTPIIHAYVATAEIAVAAARGDMARVDEVATAASAGLDASGDVDQSAHRFHSDHLTALVALGQLKRARGLAARLERRGALGPRPTWSGVAARGRALIALAEGRLDSASAHVERALRFHEPARVPLELAHTLVTAAEVERRSGRRKAAAGRLRSALGILESMGAEGWAAPVRAELRRLTAGRQAGDALTPSEERIATLASEGLRNRDIAARLRISVKTVEAALSRTYAKLGIRSRAQLAGALRNAAEAGATHGPTRGHGAGS